MHKKKREAQHVIDEAKVDPKLGAGVISCVSHDIWDISATRTAHR